MQLFIENLLFGLEDKIKEMTAYEVILVVSLGLKHIAVCSSEEKACITHSLFAKL